MAGTMLGWFSSRAVIRPAHGPNQVIQKTGEGLSLVDSNPGILSYLVIIFFFSLSLNSLTIHSLKF